VKSSSIFSVMFGLTVLGAGSESVLAQTTIAVPARNFSVDSGINVSRDSLKFSAIGQGNYGNEGALGNSTPLTNPDGDRFVNRANIGKKDDPNAIYKGFIGELVGKVGAKGNYFFIGRNQLSMAQSGKLFLDYNDVANSFNNNTRGDKISIDRISDPNQQNTAGRSLSPSQQAQTGGSQELTRCVRWSSFSQGLTTTSGGRGGIWLAFNELPDGFKQGCIFFEDNNSLDVAYVLKDGIEPSAVLSNGLFYDYYGGVPSFGFGYRGDASHFRAQQSRQSLEDLMRRGQALLITWLTPTNSSIPYLNSIPRGRAFVRDDGMVCFFTVCMKSSAVSNQELARILEAGQNVNTARRSPSPNQQTNTGRSLLLQEQGVLASGDSVLPSDNSLYDQYTFQGTAGQSVTVTVESSDFDTYVAVFSPDGKLLRENDDINQSSKNSGLTVTIPSNGTYRVIVNGYDNKSRGRYALSVSTPTQQSATNPAPSQRQQNATGRSPSPSQQNTGERSPSSNQQNPQRQTQINGDDTIVYNNIVCSSKTRNFLGQESPASCRSKEADSRLIFNSLTWERQADSSIKVEMKVFNQGSAEALIEIYDSKNRLVDLKIIDGNKPPTGLMDSGIDMFTRFPISLFNQYPLTDARKNLNEQEFSEKKKNSIIIPSGGYLKITKSSNQALRYNAALLSLELALLGLGDPKFAEDETVKQFVKRFAQEAYFSRTSKATINLFKSEPNTQVMFRMDVVDPKKAAELLQQFVQYTVTIESDPSKNPFIGAFLDVYKDVGNIGLEIALDKFILPGLGTFVKKTRIAGSTLNTFARAADLYYAKAAGEKATITLQDAERLPN